MIDDDESLLITMIAIINHDLQDGHNLFSEKKSPPADQQFCSILDRSSMDRSISASFLRLFILDCNDVLFGSTISYASSIG